MLDRVPGNSTVSIMRNVFVVCLAPPPPGFKVCWACLSGFERILREFCYLSVIYVLWQMFVIRLHQYLCAPSYLLYVLVCLCVYIER